MDATEKDPTDLGLSHLGSGGSRKDRAMAKKRQFGPAISGAARSHVLKGTALGRLLGFYDTDGRIDLGDGMRSAADLQTLKERLVELAEALGGKAPSSAALKLWGSVLKDYPIEDICDAIQLWARTKTKFPAPSEIASLCARRLSERIEGQAVAHKSSFAAGASKILADPRIARTHLAKCLDVLKVRAEAAKKDEVLFDRKVYDAEWIAEREAMLRQEEPV